MKSATKSIFPNLSGKYGVGVQDFTKKSSFLTRVFYPAQLNSEYTSDFWHPDLQYLKSYQPLVSNPDKLHPLTLNSVQHGAAPLSGLTFPGIIFSHGLFGNRFSSSALCSQLASKGYVVYAIEHNDGTASVTRRLNENNLVDSFYYQKQPKKLDSKVFKFRLNQLETRKNEILELANELNQDEHFNMTKSPSETNDLTIGGHSFGAATSFVSYVENQDVFKTSFGLDTWTFMLNKEQLGAVTENKILSVMSEEFMGFPAVAKKIQKNRESDACCARKI